LNCPTGCTTPLVMAERKDVEIDYCPHRGVWLDRGGLDKIIERASEQMIPRSCSRHAPPLPQHAPNYWDSDDSLLPVARLREEAQEALVPRGHVRLRLTVKISEGDRSRCRWLTG
jgi:Zn-finger nucleic acid-binding protein